MYSRSAGWLYYAPGSSLIILFAVPDSDIDSLTYYILSLNSQFYLLFLMHWINLD